MIGRLADVIEATDSPQQISLTVLDLGDNLTLTCPVNGNEVGLVYWYKQSLLYVIQTIASGTFDKAKCIGQFDNPRFEITPGETLQSLRIRNVSKEDEAIYFCQAGSLYGLQIYNGTILAVNDHQSLQKNVYVEQSPKTASVQLGDPATLRCSFLYKNERNKVPCPAERSVYWFRAGAGGFHPGVIYPQRSDEEEERSCVYSLSKTILNSSDAGIYYCAVVTCGEILFGGGTTVETRQTVGLSHVVLGILLLCCLIVIVALILARKRKLVCDHCRGEMNVSHPADRNRSAEDQSHHMEGDSDSTVYYAALDFSRNTKRSTAGHHRAVHTKPCD
ncbi:uncharacterized protein LOC115049819 isoform X2 [Echeneis naucrates]|uniref:uncharacterized protein LOC115049819 isoform X2 n=1 Tax=Echeneis naucrates TaxID=173247 RepID=UPI0011137E77|nr:uncharacterized protein LOC115049819 isoform X2 [Echeneis naucrates]